MSVKLLTGQHFLSLKGGCTGLSESSLVKMPHCWKSCVMTHIIQSLYNAMLCLGSIEMDNALSESFEP